MYKLIVERRWSGLCQRGQQTDQHGHRVNEVYRQTLADHVNGAVTVA